MLSLVRARCRVRAFALRQTLLHDYLALVDAGPGSCGLPVAYEMTVFVTVAQRTRFRSRTRTHSCFPRQQWVPRQVERVNWLGTARAACPYARWPAAAGTPVFIADGKGRRQQIGKLVRGRSNSSKAPPTEVKTCCMSGLQAIGEMRSKLPRQTTSQVPVGAEQPKASS